MKDTRRILLVRLDHMGDVVLTVPPVVHSLSATYPRLEIDVLTTSAGRALLASDPAISKILVFDPPWSVPPPGAASTSRISWLARNARFLSEFGISGPATYDSVFYLSFSPWERLLTCNWSSIRAGFVDPYKNVAHKLSPKLLTHTLPLDVGRHSTDSALDLVNLVLPLTKRQTQTRLFVNENTRRRGRELLGTAGPNLLIIHSGTERSMKSWPLKNYRDLADALKNDLGAEPVFVGRPDEIEFIGAANKGNDPPRVLATPEIEDLMGVALHAALFVANDGGPMHIAASLGVPTLGIFGPTDERVFGPRGARSAPVRQTGICGQQHYPWLPSACCRLKHRECLRGIEVKTVVEAAAALLSNRAVAAC